MISTCCPTLNFPSIAAGAAARITPCSCDTDATVSSGWSLTAPNAVSSPRWVGPISLDSDRAPASTTKCDAPGWCDTTVASTETVVSRSEEHTSELQSPCNLVCRLLLEKKKRGY